MKLIFMFFACLLLFTSCSECDCSFKKFESIKINMTREMVEYKILKTAPSKVINDQSGDYSGYTYKCSGSEDFVFIEYRHQYDQTRVNSFGFNTEKVKGKRKIIHMWY